MTLRCGRSKAFNQQSSVDLCRCHPFAWRFADARIETPLDS